MADRLLLMGRSKTIRSLAGGAGVSLPPSLRRTVEPWSERELEGQAIAVLRAPGASLDEPLARTLAEAGANAVLTEAPLPFIEASEAWSRPILADDPERRLDAIVLDATGIGSVDDLRALHTLLQPRLGSLRGNGRVLLLARPPEEADGPEPAACRRAVEGFMRSLARELGRKGSTANELLLPQGAESRLAAPTRWFLSARSAYVSGQVLRLSTALPSSGSGWRRPLDGRLVLVTGAARGIGEATVAVLVREGARVIALDRPGEEDRLAAVVGDHGLPLAVDLSSPEAPERIAACVREQGGGLYAAVHNAGITRDKTLGRMPPELWEAVLDVNLRSVLRLHAALDPLLAADARVVCLSSIAGLAGNPGQTAYAASKAGIAGLVADLGPRLAPRGIAVNAIAPGFIETRLTAAIPLVTREFGRRLCNLSQGGLPQDVAEAILYFCSPGGGASTGQVLRVCGGSLVGA